MREMALRERAPSALMVGESRRRGLRVAMNLAGASPRWERAERQRWERAERQR